MGPARWLARRRSRLFPDSSAASCTQRQVPQPSTGLEMAVVFFALRTSPHQTVLMCTCTWLPPTMQETALECCARFHRLGDHQGEYGRPKLYPRPRSGLVEISCGFSVVQTLQRQFWRCPIDARSSDIGEVAHRQDLWPGWEPSLLVAPATFPNFKWSNHHS